MDFFLGQILPLAFGYAPKQTAFCAGQMIPISQNQALYALLGTTFGGAGGTTFGLPNATGRTLIGFGSAGSVMPLGAIGGETAHVLVTGEMPTHTHALNATDQGSLSADPTGGMPGTPASGVTIYGAASNLLPLGGVPLANQGGGQPHDNMQPSLPINFAIVLYGIFPSRS